MPDQSPAGASLLDWFPGRAFLPVLGAPMFLASSPALVLAQCLAGVPGIFPSINARSPEQLEEWLAQLAAGLASAPPPMAGAPPVAPFGVNLIVHRTNPRLAADLARVVAHRVPFVVTSVGSPREVVPAVHAYGGRVLHDVSTVQHAHKAAEAGVDGLILVCAGAGGHAGTLSPFAFVSEVREFWSGPLVVAGAISNGRAVRAVRVLGADLAYLGTRFLATTEANVPEAYKQMIVDHAAGDILYTGCFSGVPANYLRPSIVAHGIDPASLVESPGQPTLKLFTAENSGAKPWKDIWSAGHGIGTIHAVRPAADVVAELRREYDQALQTPR